MNRSLFRPNKIFLPPVLILVPVFLDRKLFSILEQECLKRQSLLQATLLIFEHHALLTNFMGYSQLLLLLEFIADVRKKEIVFLGTAGSLTNDRSSPGSRWVSQIHSSSIFSLFSKKKCWALERFKAKGIAGAEAVSVDLIQRETRNWLRKQIKKGIELVEMELFPLRVYLQKPFPALVVVTDWVSEQGIVPFRERKKIIREFSRLYNLIHREVKHGKGHFN